MKRILASLAIATVAIAPAALAHSAHAAAPLSFRDVCGAAEYATFPYRCYAIQATGGAIDATGSTPSGYGPPDLQSAYNIVQQSKNDGTGQTLVDVLWHGYPKLEQDLAKYRAQYGLPACPSSNGCLKIVNQDGNPSPLPPGDQGAAVEYALDVDMYSAICPNCHIVVVEANSPTNASLGVAEDTGARLGTVVSNSWGGPENSSELGLNTHFNHPGVAILASSGDSGHVSSFPAASQYVTAAGGTSLYKATGTKRGWRETAWSGAGSFCSPVIAQPSWQSGINTACSRRAYADVSAVADPNTGVAVYDSYGQPGWIVVGGTSVSAPLLAGVYGLAGNASTINYGSYPYLNPGGLNDVTRGSNGSCGHPMCSAGRGWDGPTGLGTPNGISSF